MWRLAERGRTAGLIAVLVFALAMSLRQVDAQETTVYVSPAAYTVPNVGYTFSVNVSVQDVENLAGWAFRLYYPNGILSGSACAEGPFLKSGGVSTFFYIVNFTDKYNASDGLLNVFCSRTENVPGANGSGTLATVTFKSLTTTTSPETLHLADVQLSDPNGTPIALTARDGTVTVVPEFPSGPILPLLVVSTLAVILLRKRMKNHGESRVKFHSV
jgi:hypothetical protein